MGSSLLNTTFVKPPQTASISANRCPIPFRNFQGKTFPIVSCREEPVRTKFDKNGGFSFTCWQGPFEVVCRKCVIPVAASVAIVFGSNPAYAGLLSGFSGIESVPGPKLPEVDFLTRFNEGNQKKYAENDARFKESPLLKKLLEQSKLNKEKNKRELADKYCLRGAEWGIGDCSTEGMSPDERDKFIAMLKQKVGNE